MSADDGAGLDKALLPNAAATFSSFINKNTTGKKFAPKAARRRPALPSTPAPATETPVALAAAKEPPAQIVVELSTAVAIPVQPPQQAAFAREEEGSAQPALQQDEGLPQPLLQEEQSSQEDSTSQPQPVLPQNEAASHESTEQVPTVPIFETASDTATTHPTSQATDSSQPPPTRRRRLPWVAVNHPEGNDDAPLATAKKTRQPAKSRNNGDTVEAEQDDVDSEEIVQPAAKRLSAKARGKRKADATNVEDDTGTQQSPKRARRARKAKGKAAAEPGDPTEDDVEAEVEGGEEIVARRKPRQAKRKKQATEGAVENTETKRKGRPPRQATPSDAEDEIIDPETTFMDGLASRNIRKGKLSELEKKMRKIDWVAVRQRQREEANRPIPSKKELEAAENALAEEGATHPEMRTQVHIVNGQIQVLQDSGTVNREADAQREIENLTIVEHSDLTTRINTSSYIKSNKRFPNEFILPGNGRKWTIDSTERFYQGLRFFGTDFQMISHMFPGFTRRAIKTKFTREEREHPDRVKEALHGRSEIHSHWDQFLSASNLGEDNFADADKIKQELEEEKARMEALIAAAKLETEERKEQRRLAGISDDEESTEKRKGKKKTKSKQVTPLVEEGVEIVEYLE